MLQFEAQDKMTNISNGKYAMEATSKTEVRDEQTLPEGADF